jgi:hypothetical protein
VSRKHEKMLNIPGHEVNTNLNYIKLSTSLLLEWLPSGTQTANVAEDFGKMESSHTADGNVN